jgi:hypothetical protein
MGCPIRILEDHSLHAAPLKRFAGLRVLLRLEAPRHPPCTLCSLFSSVSLLLYGKIEVRTIFSCVGAWCLIDGRYHQSSYRFPRQLESGKQMAIDIALFVQVLIDLGVN